MKAQKRVDYLSSLRAQMVALTAVKCRMSHERVVIDVASALPVVSTTSNSGYQRIGLCPPQVRALRMACSHTMARIKLGEAIKELKRFTENEAAVSGLDSQLNFLNNQIHLLDHRKGEAERVFATNLAETPDARNQVKTEIQEMELLHDKYVNEMALLRDQVICAIDKLIESSPHHLEIS